MVTIKTRAPFCTLDDPFWSCRALSLSSETTTVRFWHARIQPYRPNPLALNDKLSLDRDQTALGLSLVPLQAVFPCVRRVPQHLLARVLSATLIDAPSMQWSALLFLA